MPAGVGGSLELGGAPESGGSVTASGGLAEVGGADASGGAEGTGGSASTCEGTTVADFSLVGWAAEGGGTTGGQNGDTVTVRSGAEFTQALAGKSPGRPLTVLVIGTITPQNSGGAEKLDVKDVQDVSIIGGDAGGGEFDGIGLRVLRAKNIVFRNLHIHHVDIGEKDGISLQGPADHIWIDHCELDSEFHGSPKETYDGLIDAKNNVEYVTYSWNYLHDSWNAGLAGSSDTDLFDRKLTMHHNRVLSCDAGMPSFRGGKGHIFNNLYEDIESITINSRMGACLRIENNVFRNARNPWASAYSSEPGGAELVCNSLDAGSVFDGSVGNAVEVSSCEADVPYDYSGVLTETASVEALVTENAGVGRLTDPSDYWTWGDRRGSSGRP